MTTRSLLRRPWPLVLLLLATLMGLAFYNDIHRLLPS